MNKRIYFAAIAALTVIMLSDCRSKSTVDPHSRWDMNKMSGQSFKEIEYLPCQGMDVHSDYIVVWAQGRSRDPEMAKERALTTALGELSRKLSGAVTQENEMLRVSEESGGYPGPGGRLNESVHDRLINVTRTVADANVAGYRLACEKNVIWEDGSYGYFCALEFGKMKLVRQLFDGLSVKKLLRVEYQFDQFCKRFDEGLEAYEKESK